ncbi:hypothetical protein [Streptomyces roseochromogenus]|uniref:hypothetical protein n=1 Tax=Streptomyces roseochromogenus TaxID=285450 RepID=UPI000A9FBF97|nr:hypothetical protein [Streptomyces roseochromogenus]
MAAVVQVRVRVMPVVVQVMVAVGAQRVPVVSFAPVTGQPTGVVQVVPRVVVPQRVEAAAQVVLAGTEPVRLVAAVHDPAGQPLRVPKVLEVLALRVVRDVLEVVPPHVMVAVVVGPLVMVVVRSVAPQVVGVVGAVAVRPVRAVLRTHPPQMPPQVVVVGIRHVSPPRLRLRRRRR